MRPVAARFATQSPRLPRHLRAVAVAVLMLAAIRSIAAPADAPAGDTLPRDTVLRVHGSDSIGASLMGNLLVPFLRAGGWTELTWVPAVGNRSYSIVGRPSPSGKLAGVYVEISDPESALAALDQGFADIAMSSRRARPAEARQLARLGDLISPECEHVLALDAVAVITNAANSIDSLTRQQLKDIYARRIVSWHDVGGSGPIHLYARDAKSGAYSTFQSTILEDEEVSTDARRITDNRSLADAVAGDPRGVGFVALAFTGRNRILGISDGQPEARVTRPGAGSIRNGEYPMSRRLYLYTASTTENVFAKKFITFATGPAGQAIVTKDGFLSATAEVAAVTPPSASPTPPLDETKSNPSPNPAPEPTPRPRRNPGPTTPEPRATPDSTPAPAPRPPRPTTVKPKAAPTASPATQPDAQPPAGAGG